MQKNKVIVICGPTASGKTSLSIELAKQIDGEIVSCDSMQIYKNMTIGTAKPTKEEMQGIKHYLIDCVSPEVRYSVADYKKDSINAIKEIIFKGKVPIIVGGTGLYLESLIYGIEYNEIETDLEYRKALEDIEKNEGLEKLYEMAKQIDEQAIEKISHNDKKRIFRVLEIYHSTGKRSYGASRRGNRRPQDIRQYREIHQNDRQFEFRQYVQRNGCQRIPAIPSDDADPPSGPEPALRHLPNDDSVRLYGCRVPAETTQMGCFGTESIHDLDRTYQLDFRCHNLPVNVVRLQMSVGGDAGPLPVRVVRRRIAVANADRTYDTYTQGSFFPKPCFMARHDNDLCSHGNRHPDSVHSLRYVHRTGYATMGLFPLADSHTAGLLCIDARCKNWYVKRFNTWL